MSTVVSFENVSKRYRRGRERVNLRAALPGRLGEVRRGVFHQALSDISFELSAGESLGFVGPNGAGKSTTLRLVAGVIAPTSGQINVRGRSASLIELGAGFHPDMTGRENVFFSASVLGMGPRALRGRFDQIVEFAGIDRYLDTPVKRYSSGMLARLGFAVAAHLDVEIVVLDEVLAVGDAAFQRKCHGRIAELRAEGAALLYVTHALWTLPQLCDRAVLLVEGTMVSEGHPTEVLRAYERHHAPGPAAAASRSPSQLFRSVTVSPPTIEPGGALVVEAHLDLVQSFPYGQILIAVSNSNESLIGSVASTADDGTFDHPGPVTAVCRLDDLPLQPGPYTLAVAFCGDRRLPVHDDIRYFALTVRGEEVAPTFGATRLPASWRVRTSGPPAPHPGPPAERHGL